MKALLFAIGLIAALAMPALAQNFGPPELIAAAKKEGRLVFNTANFAEVEQEVIKAFNKRFPEIRVEMVRAPGGQLITRIKTEAAAGRLAAGSRKPFGPRLDARASKTCSWITRRPMRRTTGPTFWCRRSSGRKRRSPGRSPTTPQS